MIKRILHILLFVICLTQLSMAKIYEIPEELKQEVRASHEAYTKDKESNEAKFNLAMTYAYTGQIKKGWDILKTVDKSYSKVVIDTYNKKIEAEPGEWRNHFKIAFGYFFAKKKQKAIDEFYTVLKLKPDMVWALGFIALIRGEMGEVDEAIRICNQALDMEPQATAIHFLLAEGYRKKGQYVRFLKQMLIVGRLQTEEKVRRRGEP